MKSMIDRQVARWKGTSQEEYLRPETLFNATKFDAYYAAREVPIANGFEPSKKTLIDKQVDELQREVERL